MAKKRDVKLSGAPLRKNVELLGLRLDAHSLYRFAEKSFRDEVAATDLVIAIDRRDSEMSVFYGEDLLHEVTESGVSRPVSMIAISIDASEEFDDSEYLGACMVTIKGSCDLWEGEQDV